ncbi:hypothetical protein TWF102_010444 [Orbilia oligospora]|uniref:Uncharacterized protein n=1 Tax=Orbilia oligospora TaxID=2813651 RepID=A0A7C8J5P7_ORBOL|nr:hypothetical protein TWF102_010444 [Orbilia oligospora]KAF3117529.1 hypothetical protein TWF103_006259 [Orbilia oligospora]
MPGIQDTANQQESLGPALYRAVLENDRKEVRSLLNKGADPNTSCSCGTTCLAKAAEKGHLNIFNLLVTRGASWDTKNKDDESPKDLATRNGNSLVLGKLRTADLERQDHWFSAARDGQVEKMRDMMDRSGLDPGIQSSAGSRALEIAVDYNQKKVVEFLRDKKTKSGVPLTTLRDEKGRTALQLAEKFGHVEIVGLLLNDILDSSCLYSLKQ